MGKHYRHLTVKDRIRLYELLFEGQALTEIANQLGFHKATIYRELERNSNQHGYRPDWDSQQYLIRKFHHGFKLDKNPALKELVINRLKEGWSPQQIAGRLKKSAGRCLICHETIYAYLYSPCGKAQNLHQLLHKKRRFRYPRIQRKRQKTALEAEKTRINQRNNEINQRQSFGHWEGDLLLFSGQYTHLITLRERQSRYVVAIKNGNRKPQPTADILVSYMKKHGNNQIHSLTLDNDISFTHHPAMAKGLAAEVYFCEPYKSWQKGGIENANGLIRRYLPRKTNIENYSQEDIEKIIDKLNNQPMRCLGYKTPKEAFFEGGSRIASASSIRT